MTRKCCKKLIQYVLSNDSFNFSQDSQPSSIAPQPVGYTAGLKGCEERIEGLRRISSGADNAVYIAVENFIVEILPDR